MATTPYITEPFTDFSLAENIKKYEDGLHLVQSYLGKDYDLIINGKRVSSTKKMSSYNPSNHDEIIGHISQASIEHADMAMEAALKAFESWKNVPAQVRADVLFKAAAIIRKRKFEFNALLTKEAGKPWSEADGDTAEAIDFLEYYGRQMLSLDRIDDAGFKSEETWNAMNTAIFHWVSVQSLLHGISRWPSWLV
jgi:1-pyrroline-5-carboxylate dehydrogenase